jgi:hypothetical protein
LDSSSNSAASDKGYTGALYSKNGDPAAEVGMALVTTTLDLYGGVLWSGELQGFVVHEMMPGCRPGCVCGRDFPQKNKTTIAGEPSPAAFFLVCLCAAPTFHFVKLLQARATTDESRRTFFILALRAAASSTYYLRVTAAPPIRTFFFR